MITVRFFCGHQGQIPDTQTDAPRCATCGDTRISHVQAPAPRFTGFVAGPLKRE